MKHKQKQFDENGDDTEEFILSNLNSESDPRVPDQSALFDVSEKMKKDIPESKEQKKETQTTKEVSGEKPGVDSSEQDSLFEVSETSIGSACDDEDSALPPEKGEPSLEKKKIEELTAQLNAANDKYLRLMAEFDNFKRRSAKEYERMIEVANEKLMKDIIEVRENFERAFKSKAEGTQLIDGMKLIFTKLNMTLQKHGIETYGEVNQKFDPEIHDALMRMPHEKIEEGHIVEVHERGYKLKGNIIKHTKVVVSSGKPPKKITENEAVIEIK
jgi:molecular chaperone GrpE